MTHLAILTELTSSIIRDIWDWLLTNVNLIVIVGAFRAWSMHEHRKTATQLEHARIDLARVVAETARVNAVASTQQNADIQTAIAENTAISISAADGAERAYTEANSVNNKIANPGTAQRAIEHRQDRAEDREP